MLLFKSMFYFAAAFVIFFLVMFVMAVGVLLQGKAIKGSCGGLNENPDLKGLCDCKSPCWKAKVKRAVSARIE